MLLGTVTKHLFSFFFIIVICDQVTQNASVTKTAAVTTTTHSSPSKTKVSNTVTQVASSASKTVVMTTLVGGTKRVVLSVPAPLQPPPSISEPTLTTQGKVSAKTQGMVKNMS